MLDSRLSAAYTAALSRNPSRATDLKRDEIDWIGERNREVWWALSSQRKFPSLPSNFQRWLGDFYRLRIAFLQNFGNPAATQGLPVAQKLLEVMSALPTSATDPWKALQANGTVMLPTQHDTRLAVVNRVIARLAAPPSPALRRAFEPFKNDPGDPYFTVVYLASVGFGGAFTIEGTADCQVWVLFEKHGNVTVPIDSRHIGELTGTCTRDGGSTGYLALIDGHPVVVNVKNAPQFPETADVQWQRWLGGSKWGRSIRMRLRYAYKLKMDAHCPGASPECVTSEAALDAARGYVRDPFDLANPEWLTAAERTRFQQMQTLAPDRSGWATCENPVWFPAQVSGELAIGGITESHIGCHPGDAFLDVEFLGEHPDGDWWSTDNTIFAERSHLLTAALIPPSRIF